MQWQWRVSDAGPSIKGHVLVANAYYTGNLWSCDLHRQHDNVNSCHCTELSIAMVAPSDTSSTRDGAITLAYQIVVPAELSNAARANLPEATTSRITIPLRDEHGVSSLSAGIQRARDASNALLTRWKDAIGEAERAKEAKAAADLAQRKKQEKEARLAQGADDEEDDGSEDEE